MAKLTQKEIILRTLERADDWVVSWKIIKASTPYGWLGTSADRVARLLREDGLVESKDVNGYVHFRITEKGRATLHLDERPTETVQVLPILKTKTWEPGI